MTTRTSVVQRLRRQLRRLEVASSILARCRFHVAMLGKSRGGNFRLRSCERGAGTGAACKTNRRRELAFAPPRPHAERGRPHSSTSAPERPGARGGARSTLRPPNRPFNLAESSARLLFCPLPPTLARHYPTPVNLFSRTRTARKLRRSSLFSNYLSEHLWSSGYDVSLTR